MKIYYEKKKDKPLQKQNDRYIFFEKLVLAYVELYKRKEAVEAWQTKKYSKLNDSENNQGFYR